ALIFASRLATCDLSPATWRETRSTMARYCSSPSRPDLSCSTAVSYSYCIWAMGSAVQKKLATLFIWARSDAQSLPKIMVPAFRCLTCRCNLKTIASQDKECDPATASHSIERVATQETRKKADEKPPHHFRPMAD